MSEVKSLRVPTRHMIKNDHPGKPVMFLMYAGGCEKLLAHLCTLRRSQPEIVALDPTTKVHVADICVAQWGTAS